MDIKALYFKHHVRKEEGDFGISLRFHGMEQNAGNPRLLHSPQGATCYIGAAEHVGGRCNWNCADAQISRRRANLQVGGNLR